MSAPTAPAIVPTVAPRRRGWGAAVKYVLILGAVGWVVLEGSDLVRLGLLVTVVGLYLHWDVVHRLQRIEYELAQLRERLGG